MRTALIHVILAALGLSACESLPADMTPARLADTSDSALATLTDDVATALDKPMVRLGPFERDAITRLSLLPARPTALEGNSPAIPRTFLIYEQNGECWLQEDGSEVFYRFEGRACISLSR